MGHEVQHRHLRGAHDGGASPDHERIPREQARDGEMREARPQAGHSRQKHQGGGEHGDVAARDGNHVIGAGLLQPLLGVLVEARPITEQDRSDDGG